jgi:quinol-cytochrome oxidoreductase complex cytochrome b subunit
LETETNFHSQKNIKIMDSHVFIVPVAAFLMVVAIVYLESKVKMSMIEKGMNPADHKRNRRQTNPSQTLKNGLLFVGAGTGLLLAIVISNMLNLDNQSSTGIFFALIAIFGGAGLLGAYLYERKNPPPPVE